MRWLLGVLLVTAGFAGCLGTEDEGNVSPAGTEAPAGEAPADWAQRAVPFGDDHDHTAVADHRNRSTPNLEPVGYSPLETGYHGATSGDYFCGGKAELGDRTITVTHSFETDVALVVVDVSDPTNPTKVGELVLPRTHVWDVHVTDDGSYAVLGVTPSEVPPEGDGDAGRLAPSEPGHGHDDPDGGGTSVPVDFDSGRLSPAARSVDPSTVPTTTIQPVWRDACGNAYQGPETEIPYLAGAVLVDLADLENPEVDDYVPQPLYGGHSVAANTIRGEHYVLVATTNLQHQASYFSFYTIEEVDRLGRFDSQLVPYGTLSSAYPVPDDPGRTPVVNGHVDGWIQEHPETGEVLAHLANNNGGYVVAELVDRGVVEPVGTWNDYDPEAPGLMTGNIHTARPLEGVRDGRHLTVVGQEVAARPADRPTGQVILMDTTDPSDPSPVARWTLPVNVEWDGFLQFTTHYVAVDGDRMAIALWHGGVWLTNISAEHWPELPTLGAFVPDRESPSPPPPHLGSFVPYDPVVLDVFALSNGTFAAFDGPSGVYTFEHRAGTEVPVPEPWTRDAWIGAS